MKNTGTSIFGKTADLSSRNQAECIPVPSLHQKPQRHIQDKSIPLVKPTLEGKAQINQFSQRGGSRDLQAN